MLRFALSGLVSLELFHFFLAFNLITGEVIGLVGIVCNVLNILVFTRQGFKDTVNITLTALAVSDLGALITIQINNIMLNPWFLYAGVPFDPVDVLVMISMYPHNYFIRVSGFITAFAAFERCVCVVVPLKLKLWITKPVTVTVLAVIYIVTLPVVLPVYYTTYLGWTYSPATNKSYLAANFRSTRNEVFAVSYFVTDLFVPNFTFVVIIICTSIIGVKLRRTAQWKQTMSANKSGVTGKEMKVVLMLTIVSLTFIVCLIPESALLCASSLVRNLSLRGRYFDVSMCCYCVVLFMENLCNTINTFVYLKMSRKYRKTFRELLFAWKIRTKMLR